MTKTHTVSDEQVDNAATALPAVFMTEQWMGSHVYKVGNADRFKMFAILAPGKSRLTLKTTDSETADLLIQADVAERNAHMPRGGWVTLKLDQLSFEDVEERLRTSHALTAGTLPKLYRKKFGLD